MITSAFLFVIFGFLRGLLNPLYNFADVSPNSSVVSAVVQANGYISALNHIFPMTAILSMLGFMFTFETIYITYKIIRWVYIKLPFIN